MVRDVLGASIAPTPEWLLRPGKVECGRRWDRVQAIYADLTGLTLPEVMRSVERRTVDAVLLVPGQSPCILEVDERQHFNEFRTLTLHRYMDEPLGFDREAWLAASRAKRQLEQGGFARPMPPLFPGPNGRHRQRAFRDALCDLIPPLHGFAPTLRVADFEVKAWIGSSQAEGKMATLLATKIDAR